MTAAEFAILKERFESLRKFFFNELDTKSEELPVEYKATITALYDMKEIVEAAEREQLKKKTSMFLKSIEEYTGKSAEEYIDNARRFVGEEADDDEF